MPPDPCRDPDLGSVDHFQHHAPVELCDHPASRAANKATTGLSITHETRGVPSDRDHVETGSSHVRVWEVSEWAGVQVVAWAACPSCHQ